MANSAYYKSLLLSLSVVLGNLIITFSLFVPKLYALYFVSSEKMVYAAATTVATSAVNPT